MYNWTRPNGCKEQIAACQDALKGNDITIKRLETPEACESMKPECAANNAYKVYREWVEPGAGWYDLAHPKADPFPPPYLQGYLTQESVLKALGVPVNFVRTLLLPQCCLFTSLSLVWPSGA